MNGRAIVRRVGALLSAISVAAIPAPALAVTPQTPTIAVSPSILTPYISGGCYAIAPCFQVSGHTDPSAKVTVTVTDAFGGKVIVTTYAAERDDPGIGILAGDYVVAPNVTPLGTHDGTSSLLSFAAYAEDLSGNRSATSSPAVATKNSASVGDTYAPSISASLPYSTNVCGAGWCNLSTCLVFSIAGALPGQSPAGGCTGRYKMAGSAEDLNSNSFGIASEISDVLLTVYDASENVVTTVHAVGLRRGTQGFWAADILASEYETAQTYRWTLVAIDAMGNTSTPLTGTFTRFPL